MAQRRDADWDARWALAAPATGPAFRSTAFRYMAPMATCIPDHAASKASALEHPYMWLTGSCMRTVAGSSDNACDQDLVLIKFGQCLESCMAS